MDGGGSDVKTYSTFLRGGGLGFKLNVREHISQSCRCCFYHIDDFRHIRLYMSFSVARAIATC